MDRKSWSIVDYEHTQQWQVPAVPGVYVLMKVRRVEGLPLAAEVIYAGQSTSLRRRWREHHGSQEANPGLQWLDRKTEFWWKPVPVDQLDEVEAALIDNLGPSANRRRQGIRRRVVGGAK